MNADDLKVIDELMQLGYDFNVVSSTSMQYLDLEEQIRDIAEKFLAELYDWYAHEGQEYTDDHKKRTCMRFCMTIGIGVAWKMGQEHSNGEVDVNAIYEELIAPRTLFAMDEYIEDVVGIWFSSKSLQHYLLTQHFNRCYKIILRHYNLDSRSEQIVAAMVMMNYGLHYGRARFDKADSVKPYKGEMPWHWEVWDAIYGPGESEHLAEYNHWAVKAFKEGNHINKSFVPKKVEGEEFAVNDVYYWQNTLNADAGMRVIAVEKDENIGFVSAFPVFDSRRAIAMILDEVQVWDNGAEASLRVHSLWDEDFELTFYDTNYLENKDKYIRGHAYVFDIYGIAYHVNIVPEEERSFKFEGEKAVDFNKKLGLETELDDQGNPMPINFSLANLHSLMQTKDDLPEDASFQAPVNAVYDTIDFFGKKVHEIEITSPYRSLDKEKEHVFSIYVTGEGDNGLKECPEEGTPIQGVVYFQGKMRHEINDAERPSTMLHSFDATGKDGSKSVFTHYCDPQDVGQPMSQEECETFAREVFHKQFGDSIILKEYDKSDNPDMPDFYTNRNRDFWVKADVRYQASALFENEDVTNGLYRHYSTSHLPVMAYITLYDEKGNQCQWLKGHSYTAKFHYGSMTPGIKMEIMPQFTHDELVKILYNSYKNLSVHQVSRFLHKDLDFRSPALVDPMITSKEFIARTKGVNENIKKEDNGYLNPTLVTDGEEGSYIALEYSTGELDKVRVETRDGQIISISITNIRDDK